MPLLVSILDHMVQNYFYLFLGLNGKLWQILLATKMTNDNVQNT